MRHACRSGRDTRVSVAARESDPDAMGSGVEKLVLSLVDHCDIGIYSVQAVSRWLLSDRHKVEFRKPEEI